VVLPVARETLEAVEAGLLEMFMCFVEPILTTVPRLHKQQEVAALDSVQGLLGRQVVLV
jgi:hypothetical protein